MSEEVQGWANRETHAVYLYLTQREVDRDATLDIVSQVVVEWENALMGPPPIWEVASALAEWWDQLLDPGSHLLDEDERKERCREGGSHWRVEWEAIAQDLWDRVRAGEWAMHTRPILRLVKGDKDERE